MPRLAASPVSGPTKAREYSLAAPPLPLESAVVSVVLLSSLPHAASAMPATASRASSRSDRLRTRNIHPPRVGLLGGESIGTASVARWALSGRSLVGRRRPRLQLGRSW